MNKCLSIFIFLLFLTLSFSAFGQVEKPQRVPDFRMGGEDKDRRAEFDDLILARQLMTRGAYLSAVEFLEDMYAKDPSRRETVSLLLDCYLHLKAASKAELLLQRLLEKYPLDYEYHIRLFELYLQSGSIRPSRSRSTICLINIRAIRTYTGPSSSNCSITASMTEPCP